MARLPRGLAPTATLVALFGSGCTLHVVSGPVSQQRADHEYNYAMTSERVHVLRPAPDGRQHARRSDANGARHISAKGQDRGERQSDPNRSKASAGEEQGERAASNPRDRNTLRAPRRSAGAEQIAKAPRKARAKSDERDSRDEAKDDSRKLRYPYWVSVNEDERVDLEGTPVRPDERKGQSKDYR